jgi:hypothetical protein
MLDIGMPRVHLLPASPLSRLPVALLLACLACTSGQKTSTGRTERETDSVIGQSKVPGAGGVTKAMAAQDSARARAAAIDTAAAHDTQ